MAANSNLQGTPGITPAELQQAVNSLYAALRNGPPPLDAIGAPTDGTVDLGGPQNRYRALYATSIHLGTLEVDADFLAGLLQRSTISLTPATTGSGLDLRSAGLVPADARNATIQGRSGGGGAGGGGGGGGEPFMTISNVRAQSGGGGGGVSSVELDSFVVSFGAADSIIAVVGSGGAGGVGGELNQDGSPGSAGGITSLIIGSTTHSFLPSPVGMGGMRGALSNPGMGAPGAQSGMIGEGAASPAAAAVSGLVGGAGGMGATNIFSSGGNGGKGEGWSPGLPLTEDGLGTPGTNGSNGRSGLMIIQFS